MKIQKKSDFIKWNLLKNKTKKVEYNTPPYTHHKRKRLWIVFLYKNHRNKIEHEFYYFLLAKFLVKFQVLQMKIMRFFLS